MTLVLTVLRELVELGKAFCLLKMERKRKGQKGRKFCIKEQEHFLIRTPSQEEKKEGRGRKERTIYLHLLYNYQFCSSYYHSYPVTHRRFFEQSPQNLHHFSTLNRLASFLSQEDGVGLTLVQILWGVCGKAFSFGSTVGLTEWYCDPVPQLTYACASVSVVQCWLQRVRRQIRGELEQEGKSLLTVLHTHCQLSLSLIRSKDE